MIHSNDDSEDLFFAHVHQYFPFLFCYAYLESLVLFVNLSFVYLLPVLLLMSQLSTKLLHLFAPYTR